MASKFDSGCGCGGEGEGEGGHGDHKSNVCCNAFAVSYGTVLDEGAQIVLATVTAVVAGFGGIPPPQFQFKERLVMIRAAYVSYNALYQQAVLQAQKKGCGEGCCEGIALGLKSGTLGVIRLAITNALNPLFTLPEVAEGLNLSVELLEGVISTILRLAGCCFRVRRGLLLPIVAPPQAPAPAPATA